MQGLRCLIFNDANLDTLKEHVLGAVKTLPDSVSVRVLISDSDSTIAAGLSQEGAPPLPSACISIDNMSEADTLGYDTLLSALFPGSVVARCETREILNPNSPLGKRTPGTVQLCTFEKRADLDRASFIQRWLGDHTEVAVETQSTFGYYQNLVAADCEAPFDAIVEEHFPIEAATSPEVFFDAPSDTRKLQENVARMMASCERFIQQDTINVIHMSEYKIR